MDMPNEFHADCFLLESAYLGGIDNLESYYQSD